jgi:glycosyltransferase involved in cell wall biosynthesis
MRWKALRAAIRNYAPCDVIELPRGRSALRQHACLSSPQQRDSDPWFGASNYCPVCVERIVDKVTGGNYSTVVCSGLPACPYTVRFAESSLRVVFDMHNVEAHLHASLLDAAADDPKFAKIFTKENQSQIEVAESQAVAAADELWTCSQEDLNLVTSLYGVPESKVKVVPNAVEMPDGEGVGYGHADEESAVQRVTFTGRLDYLPNILASFELSREIAPALSAAGCDLPVVIAGADPDPRILDHVPENVRVVADPAHMNHIIRESIMAIPLTFGGGSRFKILEAFSLGVPVVSTSKGVEGLRVTEGLHYLRAETAEEFTSAIKYLIEGDESRLAVTSAARDLVRESYSISALTDCMADTFLGAPHSRTASAQMPSD